MRNRFFTMLAHDAPPRHADFAAPTETPRAGPDVRETRPERGVRWGLREWRARRAGSAEEADGEPNGESDD